LSVSGDHFRACQERKILTFIRFTWSLPASGGKVLDQVAGGGGGGTALSWGFLHGAWQVLLELLIGGEGETGSGSKGLNSDGFARKGGSPARREKKTWCQGDGTREKNRRRTRGRGAGKEREAKKKSMVCKGSWCTFLEYRSFQQMKKGGKAGVRIPEWSRTLNGTLVPGVHIIIYRRALFGKCLGEGGEAKVAR